ncbi:MAG: hypothetical protein BZY73_01645 [SAR202 cluster bacterium Casp-Chloro-G3]|nr:MAG: hypothetical protein BZY73_01645 [SAR202 cluster bacterium Casp-Chloro-G3]
MVQATRSKGASSRTKSGVDVGFSVGSVVAVGGSVGSAVAVGGTGVAWGAELLQAIVATRRTLRIIRKAVADFRVKIMRPPR